MRRALSIFFAGSIIALTLFALAQRKRDPIVSPASGKVALKWPGVTSIDSAISPAGKHRIYLGRAVQGPPTDWMATACAAMCRVEKGKEEIVWTASFPWTRNGMFPPSPFQVSVAEDGCAFAFAQSDETWILVARGQEPRPLKPCLEANTYGGKFNSHEGTLAEFDSLQEQPIIRVWNRTKDEWEGFYVLKEALVTASPELREQWNKATRLRILAGMARARNERARRALAEASPKISKLTAPAMAAPGERMRQIHFEFLVSRRMPEDRKIFVDLISHHEDSPPPAGWRPPRAGGRFGGYSVLNDSYWVAGRNAAPLDFSASNYDRIQSDWLLAVFDGRPLAKGPQRFPTPPLYYLGKLSGAINLPCPIPNSNGRIRIYLAPETRAGKEWSGGGIELIEEALPVSSSTNLTFTFNGVDPGPVRLKAIWDKRPGFGDSHSAGPGDYESDWTASIAVKGGDVITNVLLLCTNRASAGGENYYAADAVRRKQSE